MIASGVALALLLSTVFVAFAYNSYDSWTQSGYTLTGQTNPIDYYTDSRNQTFYRAAVFSTTSDWGSSGVWLGVLNEAGDMCGNGSGSFLKASSNWQWAFAQSVWAMASQPGQNGWILSEECGSSGHSYQERGGHNLHTPDGSINIGGDTRSCNPAVQPAC